MNWEEGTLVEWETDLHLENGKDDKVRILLRNVDDKILGDTHDEQQKEELITR